MPLEETQIMYQRQLEDLPHCGIKAQTQDNQVKEEEQLNQEVLARRQDKHADDKQTEMLVQAKEDLKWQIRGGQLYIGQTQLNPKILEYLLMALRPVMPL